MADKDKLTKEERDFLRPDFSRKWQFGNLKRIVGQIASVGDGEKLKQHLDGEQE